MTARIIDGKAIAQALKDEVRAAVEVLVARGARRPGLAVVMVGDNPASAIYVRNKRLVRGLDYYTRTTFEFVHEGLGAQSGVGGGGRYDALAESLGGPAMPGVGFGLGVDRTLLACEAEGLNPPRPRRCEVFAVPLGLEARDRLFALVTTLRRAGVAADLAYGGRGLKGAMRAADRSGARLALVAGDRDLAEGTVQVKDLATGEQVAVRFGDVPAVVTERLP